MIIPRNRLQAAIFAALILFQFSCSSTAPNLERDYSHFKGVEVTLFDLAQNPAKSGLDFEKPAIRQQLISLAQRYVQSKSKKKPGVADDFIQECLNELKADSEDIAEAEADSETLPLAETGTAATALLGETVEPEAELSEKAVFCQSLQKSALRQGTPRRLVKNSIRQRLRKDFSLIRKSLIQGDLEKISQMPEVEINSVLRSLKRPEQWEKIYQKSANSPCLNAAIPTALAMRSEEDFPEDEAVGKALTMYAKAVECAPLSASSVKAAYRLGLLHVWKEQWEEAGALFSKIMDEPLASDYRLRILFWKTQIARIQGGYQDGQSSDPGEEFRRKLVQEYPLSLHALLLEGSRQLQTKLNSLPKDSPVKFRSLTKPELNEIVRTAEAIHAVSPQRPEYARDVLMQAQDKVGEAEAEFQLYFSVLLHRTNETIPKFQVLSGVLKKNPAYLSRASLELLYPLPIWDEIRSQANVRDPFLVLSLIRQESAFNERARSRVGAVGLMQVMPRTARLVDRSMTVKRLYQPENNLKVGIRYFNGLTSRYEGDVELALAAYNAGPHRVDKWKVRYPTRNRILFLDLIPFKETREYVSAIARNYFWYSSLYQSAVTVDLDREIASTPASSPAGGVGGRDPNSSKAQNLRVFDQLLNAGERY